MPRHLPKHMLVALTEPPPPIICHSWKTPSTFSTIGVPEKCKTRAYLTKTKATGLKDIVRPTHYEALTDGATQMKQHADVQHKDMERLSQDWRQGVGIANKYKSCLARLLYLLLEFQHMCEGRLSHISIAKHQIRLLKSAICTVRSTPYRTDLKNCEFETTKIDNTSNENIA